MAAETQDGPVAGADQSAQGRGIRRTISGVVTSDKMDKTITVTVIRRVRDRRFHKFVQRKVKYHAHDERNECKLGDRVELVEFRPTSKTKRWRFSRMIEKAREDAIR